MMPHPTTMSFAWDNDVLRGTRVLLAVLGLTLVVLLGGAMLIHSETSVSPAVTSERNVTAMEQTASRSMVSSTGDWR